MAQPGTVPVSAPIDTYALGNTYPTHKASRGLDDSAVATFADLALISPLRISPWMERYVIADGEWYQLQGDLITWSLSRVAVIPSNVMTKPEYDVNDDGIVDDSSALEGSTLADVLDRANHTGTQAQSTIVNLGADLALKLNASAVGVTVAQLVAGVVPVGQLPFSSTAYLGTWNATTNVPALADGTGSNGQWAWIVVEDTRDLGSGAILWLLDHAMIHNGTIWELAGSVTGSGIQQIDTDNGSLTGGTVAIDDTSYIAPSVDRNYVTDDQEGALAGSPNAATPTNYYATRDDVSAAIVVGGAFITPELYADGKTLGDGTDRSLASLGYNNGTAAVAFSRLDANYPSPIDVNNMSIDFAAWQEMLYFMQETAASSCVTPGLNRSYYADNTLYLPRHQTAVTSNRRSLSFIINFNGSRVRNSSGNDMILFDRYPTDQADAMTLISYQYCFHNGVLRGNSGTVEADTLIRLGATSRSEFRNMNFESAATMVDLQFGLESNFDNCNISDYGTRGIQLRNGQWTGAALANAQSNIAYINQFRSYNSPGNTPEAAIYCSGNHTIYGNLLTHEGDVGPEHHFFYDNPGTFGVNVCNLNNIYMEFSGCSRAAYRFRAAKGQYIINQPRSSVVVGDMPVLFEGDNDRTPTARLYIRINNSASDDIDSKLRAVGDPNYPVMWWVENVRMNDNVTLNTAANFETGIIANSYIPNNSSCKFIPAQ